MSLTTCRPPLTNWDLTFFEKYLFLPKVNLIFIKYNQIKTSLFTVIFLYMVRTLVLTILSWLSSLRFRVPHCSDCSYRENLDNKEGKL